MWQVRITWTKNSGKLLVYWKYACSFSRRSRKHTWFLDYPKVQFDSGIETHTPYYWWILTPINFAKIYLLSLNQSLMVSVVISDILQLELTVPCLTGRQVVSPTPLIMCHYWTEFASLLRLRLRGNWTSSSYWSLHTFLSSFTLGGLVAYPAIVGSSKGSSLCGSLFDARR